MDYLQDEIDKYVYDLEKLLESYTLEYESCGGGKLVHCRNGGKAYYYRSYEENGKRMRKALSQHPEAIMSLARKEYLKHFIEIGNGNLSVLKELKDKLRSSDLEHILSYVPNAYKDLPPEFFFNGGGRERSADARSLLYASDDKERLRNHFEWAKEPYEKSNYKPERLRFLTSAGYKVRSKSEQHIVEQLVNYDIPHRYEEVLRMDGTALVPDFTFRDRYYRKFYWEHAGMMDLDDYRERHKRKMRHLESAGIVPWDNLIVTYDVNGVINVPLIKSIIENDVIPRL